MHTVEDFIFAVFLALMVILFGYLIYNDERHEKNLVFSVDAAQARQYPKPTPHLPEGVVQLDVSKYLIKQGAERQIKYICTRGSSDGYAAKGISKFQFVNGWWYVECWAPQKQY